MRKREVDFRRILVVTLLALVLISPLFAQVIFIEPDAMKQIVSPEVFLSEITTGDRAAREFLNYDWQEPLAYSEDERYTMRTPLQQSSSSNTQFTQQELRIDNIDRNVLWVNDTLHSSNHLH